jgi:DNA-binding MarR family transcriptional regulator
VSFLHDAETPDRPSDIGTNPDAQDSGDSADLWPTLTEFALNMRVWWLALCNRLDLTPTQGLVLRQLRFGTPVPMNALADTMACDASNITGVVDKLEARGLILRQGAENDRRVKMLVVTERGRDLQRQMLALAARPPAAIAELPAAVRRKTAAAMRGVLARWAACGVELDEPETK